MGNSFFTSCCCRRSLPSPANASAPAPAPVSASAQAVPSNSMEAEKDINLDGLIRFIEQLLDTAKEKKSEGGSSSTVSSSIQDGERFLEIVEKHIDRLTDKRDFMSDLGAETQKVVMHLLKGAGKIHWVGAALSIVGFIMARFGQISHNQSECLELLSRMFNLGKHIQELDEQMPEQKKKLNEAVECIVEGSIMCCSQLTSSNIFRFLTASVNAENLQGMQAKIDRLYPDLLLSATIDIQKRVATIAPHSQENYGYIPSIGIGNRIEEVIKLLNLEAENESSLVVLVYGFGGIGKTTLADAVYRHVDLKNYKHCRISIDENCTKGKLSEAQEHISQALGGQNTEFIDCDQGRARLRS